MKQQETWEDIIGFEGIYQVSDLGRVRSLDRVIPTLTRGNRHIKGKVLKLGYDKDGYRTISLRNKKINKLAKVHRLVAETFLPKVDGKYQIDHINGIRDDNRVENLRWCTNKENLNFPIAKGNRSNSIRNSYKNNPSLREQRSKKFSEIAKKVPISVYKGNDLIGNFDTLTEAANKLGLKVVSVCACLHGRIKTIKGYTIKPQ